MKQSESTRSDRADLIRLDDGTHLWTKRIPRPIDDVLDGLGDEAAAAVEAGLRQHLLTDSASELK